MGRYGFMTSADTKILASAARKARENAWAPYSKFKVGAAVLGTDGKIYTGCNIENVSYGLTMCAERTAIFNMVSQGCTAFVAIAVAAGENPADSAPCGACRQVMCEFAQNLETAQVILCGAQSGEITETVAGLCPYPFTNFKEDKV